MRTLIALAFAALIFGLPNAAAEINMADSIEWATADSKLVVVGKVATLTRRPGPGQVIWFRARVAVAETLKGPPTKSADVVIRFVGTTPPAWLSDNSDVVLFLVDGKRRQTADGNEQGNDYDKAPYAIRNGRWGDSDVIVIGKGRGYDMKFQVLAKRDEILAAVRGAAKSTATKALQIDLPSSSPAYKALWGGSSVWMYLPIDASLEQLAISWIGSADGGDRDRGVIALAQFQSDANVARLQKLLSDPATHDVSENGGPTVRRFFVRKRAHDVLSKWGVAHTTPPIDTKP
jgi:hypothetical protein